jgi:predicted nucleic acid-binding protein
MVIIADTSPFIALVNIGLVDVLPRMFGKVTIPSKVADELASPTRPDAVREFIANPPAWLSIRAAAVRELIPKIHAGESEAICLALELRADLLLIDDADGRAAAIKRGLTTVRTPRLLSDAADRGLIDLKSAYEKLAQTDFRVTAATLESLLRQHLARRTRTE